MTERSVTILGATGSIGRSTLDVLRRAGAGFQVEALTAARNVQALASAAREFRPRFAAISDTACYAELKNALRGSGIETGAGRSAVIEAAARPADWVMAAIVGVEGLAPTLAAVERGAVVALANKECLVSAGEMFMRAAARAGARILPVDSEHNAVFQALAAGRREDVHKVALTASGGPFRTWTRAAIHAATPEQALRHPNWSMGRKVTIDSATLMNKGLELIEAHHLFALASHELGVLVHPQSIIHALVEFRDGSVVAQLSTPDMRTPIAYALAWPCRLEAPAPRLDLARLAALTFEEADPGRFPALELARAALESGGSAPTVLNAANEVAVAEFLAGRLGFGDIAVLVERTMHAAAGKNPGKSPQSLDEAESVDHESRLLAAALLPEIAAKAS